MLKLRAATAMCGALLAAMPASALDPHTAPVHYGYQEWQTDSGLPQNTVHAMAQGPEGFLWIATEGGLVRFDGAAFAVYDPANTPGLPSDLIDGLMVDRTGTLWISTSGGLAVMRGGRIAAAGDGIPATQVWRTFEDARGNVWVLTASGLFRIARGGRAEAVALGQNELTENSTMAAGAKGSLWLGTADGLMRAGADGVFSRVGDGAETLAMATDSSGRAWAGMQGGLEMCAESECHRVALPADAGAVHAVARDARGQMWAGTDGGLYRVTSSMQRVGEKARVDFLFEDREGMLWAGTARGLMRVDADGTSAMTPRVSGELLAAAEDREGDLWLGTAADGLAVLRDRKFSTLTGEDGLTQEDVLALAQTPIGHVAVGTNGGGLNVFNDGRFRAVTTAKGLSSNVVLAVAAAADGDVWVGTPDGLDLVRRGEMVRAFTTADGLADDFVRSVHVGRDGGVWVGTSHGLSRYANGSFTTWTAADGLGSDLVGAMAEGPDGTLWIGTLDGLSEFRDGQIRNFTRKDGLSGNVVTSLYAEDDGTLWIGTNDGGLDRMRGGRIAPVRMASLPERVLGILEDRAGYLWIGSNTGVYRVSRAAAERAADGRTGAQDGGETMRFGVADGMRISECSSGGHPAALRLRDGRLWFATLKGIATVNPETMPVNRVPPPVVIERVSVDDVAQSAAGTLKIAPGHSHYEFDYAGLSFVAPQKVEYRYELEGFDRGWVDAGTRRAAYYTNLPHGRYVFRVMARNNDGVWSAAAATAELTVEPHVWETVWFEALAALGLLGLAYVAWRRRLRGVEREYEAVLAERTRIAREIHDTLAQGFVALAVQLELIGQMMQRSTGAAREQLARAQALVRSSLEEARTSIWELRSQAAEGEDLAARLLKMAEEVTAHSAGTLAGGVTTRTRVQMQVSGTYHALDAGVERELLRIAREAVANAARHGDPENVWVRLEYDGSRLGMEIRDDGRGFAEEAAGNGHYGITGMRERAASLGAALTVESEPGRGTRVRLEMPLGRETEKPR